MLKVIGCFVDNHDYSLVALAALVCALASGTAVALLLHTRRATGWSRGGWCSVAGVAGGSGIWATHFIAMLAFAPGVPSGYDVPLTALSLVYAVVLCGVGFGLAAFLSGSAAGWLGGAVVGGGIAAMHYTGMGAFEVAGRLTWDAALVVSSVAFGAVLGGLALSLALSPSGPYRRLLGAFVLLLAICSHHFTAMGAVTITPDPTVLVSEAAVPNSWLAGAVAFASLAIMLLAGAALILDVRDRRHSSQEGERLRSLANATVEGLLVCDGDRIVSANRSFGRLHGSDPSTLAGSSLRALLPTCPQSVRVDEEITLEADLLTDTGSIIPVELVVQGIVYASVPHYAVAVRDLRARRKAERQIQFLAHHDPLTGLANRASLDRTLASEVHAADASGRKLAVLCMDLDRFKEVNDLFGHPAGDAMLVHVARTVSDLIGEDATMARLGGDEFVVLLPCDHAVAAGRLAETILETLARPADGDGPQAATSVGIALYPDDARDRQALMANADTALYKAKSEGRGSYRFFESAMGLEVRERRGLEHDLRHAVARGEMRVVYQPQADVDTGEVTGFEALLRWEHPTRGFVSPDVFIPIAEDCGSIIQIGEWVLREACREAAKWERPLSIAVNVSAVQIHSAAFATSVHEALLRTGLSPSRLELEVTETALIRDLDRALFTLRQLKAMGVRIAMDDFGTGYSSLSNLRKFPFDKIKIDRSFITAVDTNEQAAAIVRSVLGLGRGLGVPVMAEGVETRDELGFLQAEACHGMQGYLLGKPAPMTAFAALVAGAGAASEAA